jgi:hypothetical protein
MSNEFFPVLIIISIQNINPTVSKWTPFLYFFKINGLALLLLVDPCETFPRNQGKGSTNFEISRLPE